MRGQILSQKIFASLNKWLTPFTPTCVGNTYQTSSEAEKACSISWVASFGRGVRLSPVSTRNTDEPSRGLLKIRISDPSREAATWKAGLKGGFGFTATIRLLK